MVDTPGPRLNLGNLDLQQPMRVDFRQRGRTGLRAWSGQVLEESLAALQGQRGLQIYRDMGDQDATCGAVLYTIDKVVRQCGWRVERASDHPRDREAADFLEECRDDMDQTWTEVVSEAMSMVQYGFSCLELIYKRRCGNAPEGWMRSRFKDGRIGWRGMPLRAQETIHRWLMDDYGTLLQVEQIAPPSYAATLIPMEKLLLFRTSTHKNNPMGRSILRSAYTSWYRKRGIENIEAIGIERDLAGLPVAHVPPEVLAQVTDDDKAMLASMQNLISNIRRDEQEGVIFPMAYDETGKELYKLELLSSGGARNFDVDKVISRYDSRIAMAALADFLLLGQNASGQGSWAMHSDKTKLFAQSMGVYLDTIAETYNRFAIPRLMALNSFQVDELPRIEHDDVETADLKSVGDFITAICGAGAPLFPNEQLEKRLCEMAGLPPPVAPERQEPLAEPLGEPPNKNIQEIHEGDDSLSTEDRAARSADAQPGAVMPTLVGTAPARGRV